ncbi:MAG: M23 family metallopeptidase [Proteobacteria bacterium]|nr:M23 family metallopeptidase [Pseudomonadota bacterium]
MSRTVLGVMVVLGLLPPVNARELLDPVAVRVPFAPTPVRGDDGKSYLVYELSVVNMLEQPVTVSRVEVRTAAGTLQVIESPDLAANFRPFGSSREMAGDLTLDAGMSGLIYMAVVLPQPAEFHGPLLNRVVAKAGVRDAPDIYTIQLPPLPLALQTPMTIGPPLRGGPWLVANGPSNISGHRRLAITLNGRTTIFQRYAIDYIKIDSQGRHYTGARQNNRSYFAEGSQAIAVADAVVSAAKNDMAENVVGQVAPGATLDTVYGNFVVLDLGSGRYAIYAHLQPGSVRVKAGDRVRLGDTLGLVGNTGNSVVPHLHFQLADAAAPLAAEGLPYVHSHFERLGHCTDDLEGSCTMASPESIANAIPLNHSVVQFP